MENKIRFYYGLDAIKVNYQQEKYYFKYNNNLYSFELIRNIKAFKYILSIIYKINGLKSFVIINNIYNDIITNIDGNFYVLICHNINQFDITEEILKAPILSFYINNNFPILSWDFLWEKKVDYYKYQKQSILSVNPLIEDSFDFYMGMAENAISYLKYNFSFLEKKGKLYLCHNRIDIFDFFNPVNFTIDYHARDVSEYIKYLFFSNQYKEFSFIDFFKKLNFSYDDFILVYSRLLFPSYYFDAYDKFFSNNSEEELKKILFQTNEYITFLNYIYTEICYVIKIPEISWIQKKML